MFRFCPQIATQRLSTRKKTINKRKCHAVLFAFGLQFIRSNCQLGELKDSMQWLEKAIAVAGKKDIRLMALDDPDLKPLWNQIGTL